MQPTTIESYSRHVASRAPEQQANCWDNSIAESFFATLKVEFVHETLLQTRAQATREIFEYIEEFYNRVRRHSCLGYVSPMEFETNYVPLHQAA